MRMIDSPRFVKWAGGKQQLIEQFKPLFPKKFNNYFEPFVGSGAVAFYIIQEFNPPNVFICDINAELINAFNTIKSDAKALIVKLKQHKESHLTLREKYYYKVRSINPNRLSDLERAARFIYLNKTCFNGLYRVNSKDGFNVPMGSYKNPDIDQEEKLKRISNLLKNVTLGVMSFEKIVDIAKKEDFIYLDPPYFPLKKGKNFTTYTKNNFLEKEQKLLADIFKKLDKKGCLCMESNSDTEFIKNLYKNFNISFVRAKRLINSDAQGRGEINEAVITNY